MNEARHSKLSNLMSHLGILYLLLGVGLVTQLVDAGAARHDLPGGVKATKVTMRPQLRQMKASEFCGGGVLTLTGSSFGETEFPGSVRIGESFCNLISWSENEVSMNITQVFYFILECTLPYHDPGFDTIVTIVNALRLSNSFGFNYSDLCPAINNSPAIVPLENLEI